MFRVLFLLLSFSLMQPTIGEASVKKNFNLVCQVKSGKPDPQFQKRFIDIEVIEYDTGDEDVYLREKTGYVKGLNPNDMELQYNSVFHSVTVISMQYVSFTVERFYMNDYSSSWSTFDSTISRETLELESKWLETLWMCDIVDYRYQNAELILHSEYLIREFGGTPKKDIPNKIF